METRSDVQTDALGSPTKKDGNTFRHTDRYFGQPLKKGGHTLGHTERWKHAQTDEVVFWVVCERTTETRTYIHTDGFGS